MKKLAAYLFAPVFLVGCAYDVEEAEEASEEVGVDESAFEIMNMLAPNAIAPNAIAPNAIAPNAIAPNALTAGALSAASLSALQDTGTAGTLSRMLVRYLVSCALDGAQTFSFTWTDSQNVVHNETYFGSVGLAPGWATRGLTDVEQKWVSACIASRVNYYGTTVTISMRGGNGALSVSSSERTSWSHKEGAFWGNIFAATPYVRSCYNPAQVDFARSKQRDCAAGHWDGSTTTNCGMLDRRGSCDALCSAPTDTTDGFTACEGTAEVITTFLGD